MVWLQFVTNVAAHGGSDRGWSARGRGRPGQEFWRKPYTALRHIVLDALPESSADLFGSDQSVLADEQLGDAAHLHAEGLLHVHHQVKVGNVVHGQFFDDQALAVLSHERFEHFAVRLLADGAARVIEVD